MPNPTINQPLNRVRKNFILGFTLCILLGLAFCPVLASAQRKRQIIHRRIYRRIPYRGRKLKRAISYGNRRYLLETYTKKRDGYYTGSVQYPHILSKYWVVAKLNGEIRWKAIRSLDRWTKSQDLYLRLAPSHPSSYESHLKSTFVSVALVSCVNVITIHAGSDAPHLIYNCHLYHRIGTAWDQISVDQLFDKGVDDLQEISDLALPILKAKGASDVWSGLKELTSEDCSQFSVNTKSIVFYFAPLVLGPRSEGTFIVSIPFTKIKGLDESGPLKYLLEHVHYGK